MSLLLHVVPGDELPIYRQIMRQIVAGVAGGRLRPGERVPSHRELAETLVIAPLTVKKAYDELEAEGYLRTVRGQGTFVAEEPPALADKEKRERLRDAARGLVREAFLIGLPFAKLQQLLEEEESRLRHERRQEDAASRRTRS